jgi:hypothetical protein
MMITKNANHKSFCHFMIGDYLPKNFKRIGEGISRDEECTRAQLRDMR